MNNANDSQQTVHPDASMDHQAEEGQATPKSAIVDARLVLLYSRNSQENLPIQSLGKGQFYSFHYYDAIEVQEIPEKDGNALHGAYELFTRRENGCAYNACQMLPVFTDIKDEFIKDELHPTQISYTKKQVESFWNSETEPLLFITLMNLARFADVGTVAEVVKEIFGDTKVLLYFSFDHCDLILFCKSSRFDIYAMNMFKLNYGQKSRIADTITLCTFQPNVTAETDELFGVYMRMGVRDFDAARTFRAKLKKLTYSPVQEGDRTGQSTYPKPEDEKDIQVYSLLGRHDMGIYHRRASLRWLRQVKEAIKVSKPDVRDSDGTEDSPWYTTYALSILVPMEEEYTRDYDALQGSLVTSQGDPLTEKLDSACEKFIAAYQQWSSSVQLPTNLTMIRWMEETKNLVASFIKSPLTSELGICLVLQFLDFFRYASRFFSTPQGNASYQDAIHQSIFEFYANIVILINSMNHSSHQFVQVPSFYATAFETPPKVMAFYTVLAHRLIDVFHDDREVSYGVTLAPKFADELEVTSLAIQEVLKNEQLISISISEDAFYTLRRTTQMLAHEISHFIGKENRDRAFRRECILKCTISEMLQALLSSLPQKLAELRYTSVVPKFQTTYEQFCEEKVGITRKTLDEWVDAVWLKLSLIQSPARESESYLKDVKYEALNLAGRIYGNDAVYYPMSQLLIGHLLDSFFGKRYVEETLQSSDAGESETQYQRQLTWNVKNLLRSELSYDLTRCLRVLLKEAIERNEGYASGGSNYAAGWQDTYEPQHIVYLFSETFADMQAIALFQLSWDDYLNLFLHPDEELAQDGALRILAVTKAMEGKTGWDLSYVSRIVEARKKTCSSTQHQILSRINQALRMDPAERAEDMENLGFSSTKTDYLVKYLRRSRERIDARLTSVEMLSKVKRLRDIHALLDDRTSIYALEQGIMEFINVYRDEISSAKAAESPQIAPCAQPE